MRSTKKWDRLIGLRDEAQLSQQELAKRLGITRSALSLYELGQREPDFDTVLRIADYFGVTLDELFGRDTPQSIPEKWWEVIKLAESGGWSPTDVAQALELMRNLANRGTRTAPEE